MQNEQNDAEYQKKACEIPALEEMKRAERVPIREQANDAEADDSDLYEGSAK
jgi:hypothetical protein